MTATNMSAFDVAVQRAERQGGNASFFSLKDGETKTLRFLTPLDDCYAIEHSCGLKADIHKREYDGAIEAGATFPCPNCGQPVTSEHILYERKGVIGADSHNFMPCPAEPDKKASFICLASQTNADFNNVPKNEMGAPAYQCPVCSSAANINKQTGQPRKPAYRLYGIAVEREVVMGSELIDGMMTPVAKDAKDMMVDDHPKVVIVEMSYSAFWNNLHKFDPSHTQSICNYDWRITRTGAGLNTDYSFQAVGNPSIVDVRAYEEWIPDVHALIKGRGTPEYYAKKGYAVPGYTPQAQEGAAAVSQAQATLNQVAQPPMQQVAQAQPAQPVQPMQQAMPAQTATGNDWSVVQGQFS